MNKSEDIIIIIMCVESEYLLQGFLCASCIEKTHLLYYKCTLYTAIETYHIRFLQTYRQKKEHDGSYYVAVSISIYIKKVYP